ncbi:MULTISPECIES: metal ABC transporter solute-binding protein, Zn/Mn family [Bacillus]|uniref:metal ABC transporter solute-binding protein, Zn/Mn family n=1 Tax=Bacillus TaxID=1386 RepID=UPI0002E6697A|nr:MULTISPECIES: zinc ABC transporter substrate-binding protein [Bacillus]
MKKKLVLSFLLLIAVILTGCNQKEESNKTETLNVYTTVYPLQFFAEQIGGKYVNVHSVYPPGTDEHTFEPSQKDVIKMAESNLFLYIGYNLEGFVTKTKPILEKENVTLLAVGEKIHLDDELLAHDEQGEEHEHEHEDDGHNHGDVDPHMWLDPVLAKSMAAEIKKELIKLKPEEKQFFEENYKQLVTKLDKLNNGFKETITKSPKKEIIVSHAAYGYWEKRYGLEQIAVSGLSSSSEPSQKELKAIMEVAKEHNINYVLFEQNVQSKLTEILQKEIGAKSLQLHNLSVLTEKDIEHNKDYFSLMEKNLETLKTALQ